MDGIDYQKYEYVHCHLKSLIRQWTKLKPNYQAKLDISYRYSLYTNYVRCLSVCKLAERIQNANSKLYQVLKDIYDFCKTNHLSSKPLLKKPNMGNSFLKLGRTTLAEVIRLKKGFLAVVLLPGEHFTDVYTRPRDHFECDNLPFKDFPYEFRSRLVALFPPRDCVSFKLAGKTATKHVEIRGHFSAYLLVVKNSSKYNKLKAVFPKTLNYAFASTSFFLKSDSWYINNGLYLSFNNTEDFDRAVKTVSGSYHSLQLAGPYTWKHAIHFMNLGKNMMDVFLDDGMLLEEENLHDFFEAVVQYCKHQEMVTVIIIQCPDLTVLFNPQIKEYVENRTTFKVKFSHGITFIKQLSSNL